MKQQTADKIKRKLYELARNEFIPSSMLYQEMDTFINSLVSEDGQYTCKKCGAGWSDDTDIEIAKRKWKEFETDEDNPQYFPDWLDKESE